MYGQAAEAIGWRPCFWIEAAFGVPVAALFLLAPALDLRGEGHELPTEPGAAAPHPQRDPPRQRGRAHACACFLPCATAVGA
jgi:predicted MFS family arabinose efflux permease